jgi:D-glycero-D-manno-heptose 1,7-bisphosphate phosphatase
VFLDRDGVINANRADYILSWDQFAFLPGALKAIALLNAAGLPIVVVTNQAIVGKGLLGAADLDAMHAHLSQAARTAGGAILDILYCPHLASDNCACRKPRPGLLLMAAQKHGLDLAESYYVGDALSDLEAGRSAGCRCILVRTGRGRSQVLREEARFLRDYHEAENLLAAARWILARQRDLGHARSGELESS